MEDEDVALLGRLEVRAPGFAFRFEGLGSTLETTQGQMDGFFSQVPLKCYLPEVASVGD